MHLTNEDMGLTFFSHEGEDCRDVPFKVETGWNDRIAGYETRVFHPCYNQGRKIQVSVCISSTRSYEMHYYWITRFMCNPPPHCLDDIQVGVKHGRYAIMMYPRLAYRGEVNG